VTASNTSARPGDPRTAPRRFWSLLQTAIFITFLALPLLDSALGLDRSSLPTGATEIDQRPDLPRDLGALRKFPGRFDRYYRDHFGWRRWLIRRFHQLNYLLFRVSESPLVHVGRDGWLYYGGTATEYQRATEPFSDRDRRRWFGSIRNRHEWLESQGIRYLLVVAPNKHSIYPEHLPAKLHRTGSETRWELLERLLRQHTEVTIVGLHAPLLAAKESEQVYERTGTHWTQRGAYIAYREIFDQLDRWFPQLEPVAWEDIARVERREPADLLRMVALSGLVSEQRFEPTGGVRHTDLGFRRNADLVTEQPDHPELPRAVIIHDSFSVTLAPLLAEHFSYAVFQWRAEFDGELIQRVRPDVVIEQRVERRLQLGAIPNVLPPVPDRP